MKTLAPLALLVVLGLAAVAGCGGGRHSPAQTAPLRARSSPPLVIGFGRKAVRGIALAQGARFLSPTRLLVLTWGSGSCPALPASLVVQNPHAIRIRLAVQEPPDRACTTDLTTTPVVVAIDPKKVDVHHPVTLRLYYYRSKRAVVSVVPALRA